MNILIDTHILLWWLNDDAKLPNEAENLISHTDNTVVVSAVCGWEIAIKQSIGRLEIDLTAVQDAILQSGFSIIPITMQHSLKVATLPVHHKDPFDRLLIAQCLTESMHLLTHDTQIKNYGDFILLV